MSVGKLSVILAEIFGKAHHVLPNTSTVKKILGFASLTDPASVAEVGFGHSTAPYPAQWAGSDFDPEVNINWSEGVWA